MRREHFRFMRYAGCGQLLRCMLHDVPVAVAAHYDADLRPSSTARHECSFRYAKTRRDSTIGVMCNRGRHATYSERDARRLRAMSDNIAMRLPHILAALACTATFALGGGVAAALAQPPDADFIAARDAFRAGDSARLDGVAPRLKGHLLEPYVSYWQIKLNLADADPERVRAFLTRYDGMPLADRLRSEWLKSLGKRQQWSLFEAEYPKRAGDDAELGCFAIQWKYTRDGDTALDQAMPYWLSGQEQPD